MKRKHIQVFILYFLGILFLVSGIGKVINTGLFSSYILQYGLKYLFLFSPIIAVIEVFIGLAFLFQFKLKTLSSIIIILIIIFTLVYSYGYFHLGITNCNCFGKFKLLELNSPYVYYAKNFIILILSYYIHKTSKKEAAFKIKLSPYSYSITITIVIVLFATFFSGYSFSSFNGKTSINLKENKISPIENKFLKNIYNFNVDTTYLVFVFSYNCPHCINSIENLKQYKEKNIVDKIIYLGFGNTLKNTKMLLRHNINKGIIIKNIDLLKTLNFRFPTIYFIKNNTPIYKHVGFVDFPDLFFKRNEDCKLNF